jgi:hypothetical protein
MRSSNVASAKDVPPHHRPLHLGFGFRFVGADTFRVIVAVFPSARINTRSATKAASELRLVDVRTVLGYQQALGAPPGHTADLSGQTELDGVDHAALAGSARTRDRERFPLEIDIELPDPP